MPMFEIDVVCSDPECDAEMTVWAEDLEEVDLEVCHCGACVVTVRVSEHWPDPPKRAALVLVPSLPDDGEGESPHGAAPPAIAA
jgi:hypothetical protein